MQPELDWLREVVGRSDLEQAIPDSLTALDVYRTYIDPDSGEIPDACRAAIERADMDPRMRELLLGTANHGTDEGRRRDFVQRWQQWTGPVHAMGWENTAFYRQPILLCCNEVGCNPGRLAVTVQEFHDHNQQIQLTHPFNWNAIDTHDTKFGYYVASRIAALALIAEQWCEFAERSCKGAPDGRVGWQVLQLIVGTHPFPQDRFATYLLKAMREARLETNWITPDVAWETCVIEWARKLLASPAFLRKLEPLVDQVDRIGRHHALGQLLLMMTVPGRPAFYQGDEVWEKTLVDPDNRLPQDWDARMQLLQGVLGGAPVSSETDRMHMIRRALIGARAEYPEDFGKNGTYRPEDVGEDAVSFSRGENVRVWVPLRPGISKPRCPRGFHDLLPEEGYAQALFVRN
jgi:(1->4)-alpha-D-glucan 1-alpha-D-glucosylmutase